MVNPKLLFFKIPRFFKTWRAAACVAGCAVLCAATALAQLRLCGRCGVEALGAEAGCRECGAVLPAFLEPAAEPPAPDTDAAKAGGSTAALGELLDAIGQDVRAARELEQAQPAAAYHYYHHAIGLVRVIPPADLSQEARDGLVAGFARCRQAIARGERVCPMCNGTGRRAVAAKAAAATGPKGLASTTAAATVAADCERCRGLGRVVAPRSMEELRVAIGQGRTAFERQMRALGRVGCGRGFLPAGLEDRLTLHERALIRGALADGCAACMGIGKMDCATCKGFGVVPCKGRGCVNGQIPGVGDAPASPCAACHGAGEVACAACQANGTVSCRTCKGSGQADRCRTCGGEGVATCAACRGKGGDCKTCGGGGRALCAQCFGEGVKGR